MRKIGVLVHGLFLQANDWEHIVWGTPPYELGSLPKAVEMMLQFGLDNIGCMIFGTGASQKDGMKEAEYTRHQVQLAMNMRRLEAYPAIKEQNDFQSTRGLVRLAELINTATLETDAKNTVEEIANAARQFKERGCDLIIHVPTCGSHAPRCVKTYLQVKAQGNIPDGQVWIAAAAETTFAGSTINDVVIIEPPHRADDPMVDAPVKAHEMASKLFKLPPPARIKFLQETTKVLRERYGV